MTNRLWGPETRVNVANNSTIIQSKVVSLPNGGYAVAWIDNPIGPGLSHFYFQRYSAAGVKEGAETQALGNNANYYNDIDFTTLDNGNLVAVWADREGAHYSVYNPAGTFLMGGSTDPLSSGATSISVAAGNGNSFVFSYDAKNGNLYDTYQASVDSSSFPPALTESVIASTGNAQPDMKTNILTSGFVLTTTHDGNAMSLISVLSGPGMSPTTTTIVANVPYDVSYDILALPDRDFVLVASTNGVAVSERDLIGHVYSIVYDDTASTFVIVPKGAHFTVNGIMVGNQVRPALTALADGGFAAVYQSDRFVTDRIFLQIFNADGSKRGGEFRVDSSNFGQDVFPSVTTLADGRLVVSWGSNDDSFAPSILHQVIDPRDGVVVGSDHPGIAETLYGNDALNDSIRGFAGVDTIYGLSGADVIYGGDGNDILFGGRGDDTLYGEAGTDLMNGGLGADEFYGGTGTDTVSYSSARVGGVTVNLLTGIGSGGEAEGDFYSNVENIVGSHQNDTLMLGNVAGRLDGLNGDDTLTGGNGNDAFFGGNGADKMTGGNGVDRAYYSTSTAVNINMLTNVSTGGEAQGDTFFSIEEISGSTQGDTIIGNALNNRFFGQNGNDRLGGGAGVDTLVGGVGSDTFVFARGDTGLTVLTADVIQDYTKGSVGFIGDSINFSVALTVGGANTAATASQAEISQTTGIATFASGSGTTMADALSDIATSFTAGGNALGEFALFRVNNAGDYYILISDGVAGLGANDVLVQLQNVTSITAINLGATDLTILA